MLNFTQYFPAHWQTKAIAIILCIGLSACGSDSAGTGDTGPNDPDAIKQEQPPLYFAQPSITLNYGESPAQNPLRGGAGEGAISYTSSDTSVAAVNNVTGHLEPRKSGQTTITAVKASDANNFSAQASYALRINTSPQQPLAFEQSAIEQYIDETPYNNRLSGGSGSVSTIFSSSAPRIVSVDAGSGALTFIDEGTTTITAHRPANERYAEINASYKMTVLKYPHGSLSFTFPEIDGIIGFTPDNNPLIFDDVKSSGAVVFSSSNPTIATVHADTGVVTPLQAGTTEINAIKLSDEYYTAITASYSLEIFDIMANLQIHIGTQDTKIQWDSQYGDINVQRSRFSACDPSVIGGCFNYSSQTIRSLDELPIIDSYPKIEQSAYLRFHNQNHQSDSISVVPIHQPFLPLTGNALLYTEDTFWSFGGTTEADQPTNMVWTSQDGIHWQEYTYPLNQAASHISSVTFNNEIYVTGGQNNGYLHTIWKLDDNGWQSVLTPDLPNDTSSYLIAFDNALWLVSSAGIWNSADGISWNLINNSPEFSARNDFSLFTFNDEIYLLGGRSLIGGDALLKDIWHSSDGANWQFLNATGTFPAQSNAKVLNFNNTLYLFTGESENPNMSVYSSADAANWTELGDPDVGNSSSTSLTVGHDGFFMTTSTSSFTWFSKNGLVWRTPADNRLEWVEN
ncbi:hypothetical protein KO507_00800 [Gilvimarinus agarilyticus]|uniref:Ig-like domain-containing protein n=1 Tax=Gilvimarinus sp. 2_MG-2023 TaxID=3062666 RepID=UPI001C0A53B7|nr:Ig-like domain-containing protein [Gilvimarinus sp. 2_MG-2023]MBU2884296.1 hypothetical protein [Gilvimarinus agarilyticus]MDO6569434.1 hypothetical protein [Gilvimarinus sp. 2_MG-2023]